MQKQISAGIIISCHPDFEDDPVSGECANLVLEQIGITCRKETAACNIIHQNFRT